MSRGRKYFHKIAGNWSSLLLILVYAFRPVLLRIFFSISSDSNDFSAKSALKISYLEPIMCVSSQLPDFPIFSFIGDRYILCFSRRSDHTSKIKSEVREFIAFECAPSSPLKTQTQSILVGH